MPNGFVHKPELGDGGQWINANGMTMQLCVACELDASDISTQSAVVFVGLSLCLGHLSLVAELVRDGISLDRIPQLLIR